jgi:DNA-binding response OmpR family regulator
MKILIAEDDDSIQDVLVEVLQTEGHICTRALDGEQAIKILSGDPDYDLLISDFRMPNLDGVGLLQWCRASSIHFPVIFISATSNLLADEKLALGDCCSALLNKPFSVEELFAAVSSAQERNHARSCKNK